MVATPTPQQRSARQCIQEFGSKMALVSNDDSGNSVIAALCAVPEEARSLHRGAIISFLGKRCVLPRWLSGTSHAMYAHRGARKLAKDRNAVRRAWRDSTFTPTAVIPELSRRLLRYSRLWTSPDPTLDIEWAMIIRPVGHFLRPGNLGRHSLIDSFSWPCSCLH